MELILANALTTVEAKPAGVVMRPASPLGGVHIGISAAASVLMLLPGIALVWAPRRHLARGFSLGRISWSRPQAKRMIVVVRNRNKAICVPDEAMPPLFTRT